MVQKRRANNNMVMDRADLLGSDITRNAVLLNLDAHLVKGGKMRELMIITLILILALFIWAQKGGRE